jgi:hypothetical protein
VPPFEVRFAVLEFDGGELALQHPDKKVAAAAGRLQETGVDALGFILDEVEHRIDHPRRSEYLSVIGNALSGLDQAHGQWDSGDTALEPLHYA